MSFNQRRENDRVISKFQHERFRPQEKEALLILRKVAAVVEPIMRRRRWKVGILAEFWPAMENLQGMNVGKGGTIWLRLREAFNEQQFLPIEDIVETMLHELAHILHTDHNEAFNALFDQLVLEHEQLLPQLYTDQLFHSTGHRHGGERIPERVERIPERVERIPERGERIPQRGERIPQRGERIPERGERIPQRGERIPQRGERIPQRGERIPEGETLRSVQVATGELHASTTQSGPSEQRLGGIPVPGQDRRRAAADAATRRLNAANGCLNGHELGRGVVDETMRTGTITENDADEVAIMLGYMDLIQEEEDETYGGGSQGGSAGEFNNNGFWLCDICTLLNPADYLCCDACGNARSD